MKALITGGAGFVGSNLALYLLDRGHDVAVYDNLSREGSESNLIRLKSKFPNLRYFRKELDDIREFFRNEEPDIIYHFAAQVAVTSSYESPSRDFRINAKGTFDLVSSTDAPVIYASTNKVYGDNVNNIPLEELETRYDFSGVYKTKGIPEAFPIDAKKHTPYGCSKLTGELYVREFGGVANRFSCLYGENQYGTVDQGWVSHILLSTLKGRQVTVYGDGKQVRDILHINDVCRLLEIEAKNIGKIRGEVFNIGGGYENTISLLELCNMFRIEPQFSEWRPADQKVYYSDVSKANRVLDWKPQISKQDGIKRLYEWSKDMLKSKGYKL